MGVYGVMGCRGLIIANIVFQRLEPKMVAESSLMIVEAVSPAGVPVIVWDLVLVLLGVRKWDPNSAIHYPNTELDAPVPIVYASLARAFSRTQGTNKRMSCSPKP